MATTAVPNERIETVYDRLGDLLKEGDDAFVEDGPGIVKEALSEPGFLDGVETEPATDSYTRAKVIGEPGGHVIRYMEWPPEYTLMPHEHHGRPCFEVLVDGTLALTDMVPTEVEEGRYEMDIEGITTCRENDAGVVDPRTGNDVHAVYSPERTRSLHCYPDDAFHSYGYVQEDEDDPSNDYYRRERFELDDD